MDNKKLKNHNSEKKVVLVSFLFILFVASVYAVGQPTIIALQGKIVNETTGAVIESAALRVNITGTDGNTLWNQTYATAVSNGFFDLLLGTSADNPLNLTFNQNYNVSIYFGDSSVQIGGTYRFQGGQGLINPSNISAGDFTADGNFTFGSAIDIDKTNNRIGIGTSTPSEKLEIYGGKISVDSAGATDTEYLDFSSSGTTIGGLGRDTNDIVLYSPFGIRLTEGSTDVLTVEAGNVGIGTIYTNLFNAVGGTTSLAVTGDSSSTAVNGNTDASISIVNTDDTTDNTVGLHFAWQDTDDVPNYAGASIVAQLGAKTASQYPTGSLHFLTSTSANTAPTEKMTILENGNIGIGTSNPNATLQLAGSEPLINTTDQENLTLASEDGSVIIKLG